MNAALRAYRRFRHRKQRKFLCERAVALCAVGKFHAANELIMQRYELEHGKR